MIDSNPIRIALIALILSVIGHLILFFGLPFLSLGTPNTIPDDLLIKAELKVEPIKKIQLNKSQKKRKTPTKTTNTITTEISSTDSEIESQISPTKQAGQPFRLPESAVLFYEAYVDGQQYQTGRIDWVANENGYQLNINIPYAFIGPFIFESRGFIDAYGLAPTIYWAQRGTNNPRYSRFDRDGQGAGKMYFSEKQEFSPDILPGTQDRFSLMFQFAALLNGDATIDEANSIRSIPVVDYNTLDMWQFKSYGEIISEDVPSLGKTALRHYALMQRESDPYKRQVDLWLARDLEWLPGRIRSVEASGRVLELFFKQKSPVDPLN